MTMDDARKSGVLMQAPLRAALIGAGGYGANHLRILERFHAEGAVRFLAVADPTEAVQEESRDRLAARGVNWFSDYREMFESLEGQLDAVVISTPIPLHLPMLEAALDRNLYVFLEKPPVPLIQDFLRIAARPESSRVALGFKLLADPSLWRLKDAMLGGSLGRIISLRASACWPRLDSYYSRAGWAGRMVWRGMPVFDGPATNALAHIVHNIMFLAGPDRESFAVPETMQGELYRARPIESYDVCSLSGAFSSGARFGAAFAHAVEKKRDWSIVVEGDKGRAVLTINGVESDCPLPDGRRLEHDLFEESWWDFYNFATGRLARPRTSFADCFGYVAATNAMLVSSAGVRDLPAEAVRRFEIAGDGGYDVEGFGEAAARFQQTGNSLRDCGAEWAVEGVPVDAARLEELDLSRYLLEDNLAVFTR
jgi:predicted dehydrogenase